MTGATTSTKDSQATTNSMVRVSSRLRVQ
jgi:hypothetical protein